MASVAPPLLVRNFASHLETSGGNHPNSFRSLYRSLLRQASYLPDPLSRIYIKHRIVTRFRSSIRRTTHPAGRDIVSRFDAESNASRRGSSEDKVREPKLWREGMRALHQLERANLGYHHDLFNVILSTYGRRGKRRHELLRPFKQARSGSDLPDMVSEKLSEFPDFPADIAEQLPRLDPKLEALLNSQRANNIRFSTRPTSKSIKLEIPKTNSWLRATPAKRVANIVRRWYAERLEQAIPPLPTVEWERLRQLARGQRKWDGPVRPRSRRNTAADPSQGVRSASALSISLGLSNIPTVGGKDQPQAITNRYMRRLYSHVFQLCAKMEWNPEDDTWTIEWGSAAPRSVTLPSDLTATGEVGG